jgi:hypothetical protein
LFQRFAENVLICPPLDSTQRAEADVGFATHLHGQCHGFLVYGKGLCRFLLLGAGTSPGFTGDHRGDSSFVVEKQVGTVQNTLKEVNTRTRVINKDLKEVEILNLQPTDTAPLLGLAGDNLADAEDSAADEGEAGAAAASAGE